MRKIIDMNSDWRFAKTAVVPTSLPLEWEMIALPHTWNAVDGQDGGNDYWRGTAAYCRAFFRPEMEPDGCAILEFLGASMIADVWLNGQHLAHHEGGYSAFRVEVTDVLMDENLLCVLVNNEENDRVYPQKADFTFYGGLYRGVNLITVPNQHFELCKDATPGIKVTPIVSDNLHSAIVIVETWQNWDGNVTLSIGDQVKTATSSKGHAEARFTLENVRLWDGIHDPYLYSATAHLPSGDMISTRFGCRKLDFDSDDGFFLNGRPYPLRGVSRHQDRLGLGNALTKKEHQEDIAIIREIGANSVRLAHYQQAQEVYDLCDEYGLIVWAEIPYITRHMPNGQKNTLDQMRELITQCYNHPSIVCWGLSNEVTAHSPVDDSMIENHHQLNDLCHRMDPTRPTTMAHVYMLGMDSTLIDLPDISSYNIYLGWYLGDLAQNDSFFDTFHAKYPKRIIGFSEYGADANPQFQTSNPVRGDYTEQYQCVYHEHLLQCIEQRPYIWSSYVWNMFDFATDERDEGGQPGVNQKGLVTLDRKLKKDVFYLYKAAWSTEPFVHLCGSRYIDRAEEITEIKVYSNQPEIKLYVDGALVAQESGNRVFNFRVPISGRHTIEAQSGNYTDSIIIRKVDQPNPTYHFDKGEVINWFEKGDHK